MYCSWNCVTETNFAGEQGVLNSELWHACAGPLVSLPAVGSRVVYFPQGHSEQVSIFVSIAKLDFEADTVKWTPYLSTPSNIFVVLFSRSCCDEQVRSEQTSSIRI